MSEVEDLKKIILNKHPDLVKNWGDSAQLLSFHQILELMMIISDEKDNNIEKLEILLEASEKAKESESIFLRWMILNGLNFTDNKEEIKKYNQIIG